MGNGPSKDDQEESKDDLVAPEDDLSASTYIASDTIRIIKTQIKSVKLETSSGSFNELDKNEIIELGQEMANDKEHLNEQQRQSFVNNFKYTTVAGVDNKIANVFLDLGAGGEVNLSIVATKRIQHTNPKLWNLQYVDSRGTFDLTIPQNVTFVKTSTTNQWGIKTLEDEKYVISPISEDQNGKDTLELIKEMIQIVLASAVGLEDKDTIQAIMENSKNADGTLSTDAE